MSTPIILAVPGTPLYQQVQAHLALDTDPTTGLVAALGAGVDSVFPNFTTEGPNTDRLICPTPFIIVASGGARAVDAQGRALRVVVEIHDDADYGDERWPGLLARVKQIIVGGRGVKAFRPTSDDMYRYISNLTFEEESPPNLRDTRFDTNQVQIIFTCRAADLTSSRGYQG